MTENTNQFGLDNEKLMVVDPVHFSSDESNSTHHAFPQNSNLQLNVLMNATQ